MFCATRRSGDEPDDLSSQLHQAFDSALREEVPDDLVRLARRLDRAVEKEEDPA